MGCEEASLVETVVGEAREGCLDQIHAALVRFWARLQPPADESFKLLFSTAVAEIAANILEHARPGRRRLRLDLRLEAWPDRVEACFVDDGLPMAPKTKGQGAGARLLAERGRGLGIALAALDQLTYESQAGCNRWRLVKLRPSGHR